MSLQTFITNLESIFEETAPNTLTANTNFRDLEEWSSMQALLIIAMIDSEYAVIFSGEDLRNCQTIADIYEIVKNRLN